MQVQLYETYLKADGTEIHLDGSAGMFVKRYFNKANPSIYWYGDGSAYNADDTIRLIAQKPDAWTATVTPAPVAAGKTLIEVDFDARTVRVL